MTRLLWPTVVASPSPLPAVVAVCGEGPQAGGRHRGGVQGAVPQDVRRHFPGAALGEGHAADAAGVGVGMEVVCLLPDIHFIVSRSLMPPQRLTEMLLLFLI